MTLKSLGRMAVRVFYRKRGYQRGQPNRRGFMSLFNRENDRPEADALSAIRS